MSKPPSKSRQRGAVVLLFGLSLVVFIWFAGLAIDLGRFFVIKTELQNAMDACALSAASQLKPGAGDPNALTRAVAYGQVVTTVGANNTAAIKNRANFQSMMLDPNVLLITFGVNNADDPYRSAADADPTTAKFVKCVYPLDNLPIYFMRVFNPLLSTQTVAAMAVATRDRGLAPCIPVAVCSSASNSAANNFGFSVGQWMTGLSDSTYGTGNFGLASLINPADNATIANTLRGSGACNISDPNQFVYGSGVKADLSSAWNTRFGLYASPSSPSQAPPDHTGYAYSDAPGGNWPQGSNAYSGSFRTANNLPYDQTSPQPPGFPVNQYTVLSATELGALGRSSRRVVTAPVVDCSVWNQTPPPSSSQSLSVRGWACVLMLNPYDPSGSPGSPQRTAKLEFLGLASDAASPCAGGAAGAFTTVLAQ